MADREKSGPVRVISRKDKALTEMYTAFGNLADKVTETIEYFVEEYQKEEDLHGRR